MKKHQWLYFEFENSNAAVGRGCWVTFSAGASYCTTLGSIGAGPSECAVGAGTGVGREREGFGYFFFSPVVSLLFLPLPERQAGYRLSYCLKESSNPKQPTRHHF